MSNSSIWSIDRTLSGATTPDQSGHGGNGNEEVLRIPQSSCITEASLSDCLMSYPGHLLWESYLSAEMQSVYSTASGDWATGHSLGESYLSAEMQSVYSTVPADCATKNEHNSMTRVWTHSLRCRSPAYKPLNHSDFPHNGNVTFYKYLRYQYLTHNLMKSDATILVWLHPTL